MHVHSLPIDTSGFGAFKQVEIALLNAGLFFVLASHAKVVRQPMHVDWRLAATLDSAPKKAFPDLLKCIPHASHFVRAIGPTRIHDALRHVIAILLQNEAGSLSRVTGLISTRGLNIESQSVHLIAEQRSED